MLTRRQFLASTSTSLLLPNLAFAENVVKLSAELVNLDILPDKITRDLWGFNGSTPGPTIRAKKGERIKVRFDNALPQASAVHWHGIQIENKMDGVPGLTQSLVNPQNSFLYDFIVPDAGTYWYHSHNRSWQQIAQGLYGALIVEEDNPAYVNHDVIAFISDWRLNSDGSQINDFENIHDQSHAGRLGNIVKVIFHNINSPIKRNERIRLRLINVATDRVFPLQLSGLDGKVVAYDGMPLKLPESIEKLVLAPAQRIDIIADVINDEIDIDFQTRDGLVRLGSLPVKGKIDQKTQAEISSLESNHHQSPDLDNAIELTLLMEGGAMSRRMMTGMISRNIWAFNGVSNMPNKAFHQFRQGQTAIIDLVNDTRFPHAIHLHGHHFQAIASQRLLSLRDTILVDAGQSQKIACVFDNPGKWLLHCHMLAHQATGMTTWVEVI